MLWVWITPLTTVCNNFSAQQTTIWVSNNSHISMGTIVSHLLPLISMPCIFSYCFIGKASVPFPKRKLNIMQSMWIFSILTALQSLHHPVCFWNYFFGSQWKSILSCINDGWYNIPLLYGRRHCRLSIFGSVLQILRQNLRQAGLSCLYKMDLFDRGNQIFPAQD